MAEKALELDPGYANAYALLGGVYWLGWLTQWSLDSPALERAFESAQRAVALDDTLPSGHVTLAWIYLMRRQHAQAITEAERALALDPNSPAIHHLLGDILSWSGRPAEAITLYEKAIRLNPRSTAHYLNSLGWGYLWTGRYEEAIAALKKPLTLNPNFWATHMNLACVYSEVGRGEEARAEATELLRLSPHFSLEANRQKSPFKDPVTSERYFNCLRKAGLK